jgi:hypothetical protein
VYSLDLDAGPSVPAVEEVPVPTFTKAETNGRDLTAVDPNGCTVRVVDEDDEEEDEIPLIRKSSRRYIASGESSGVPSPALSALIGLQELSLTNFDQTLCRCFGSDRTPGVAPLGVLGVGRCRRL